MPFTELFVFLLKILTDFEIKFLLLLLQGQESKFGANTVSRLFGRLSNGNQFSLGAN